MSLLFSSHLLPDVETVCDEVLVLGAGKLLTQGNIQHLKQLHNRCFELRLKADAPRFAARSRRRAAPWRSGTMRCS